MVMGSIVGIQPFDDRTREANTKPRTRRSMNVTGMIGRLTEPSVLPLFGSVVNAKRHVECPTVRMIGKKAKFVRAVDSLSRGVLAKSRSITRPGPSVQRSLPAHRKR